MNGPMNSIPGEYDSDSIVIIAADRNPQVLSNIKSWVVKERPYEMKVVFRDDTCVTVNLRHVLMYSFIPGKGESK